MKKSILSLLVLLAFGLFTSLASAEPSYDLDPSTPTDKPEATVSSNAPATVSNTVSTADAKEQKASNKKGSKKKSTKASAKKSKTQKPGTAGTAAKHHKAKKPVVQ